MQNIIFLKLTNGFPEVSFVNEVRENAFLPSSDIVDMIQQQIAAAAPNLVKNENNSDLATSIQIPISESSPSTLLEIAQGSSSSNGSEDDITNIGRGNQGRHTF